MRLGTGPKIVSRMSLISTLLLYTLLCFPSRIKLWTFFNKGKNSHRLMNPDAQLASQKVTDCFIMTVVNAEERETLVYFKSGSFFISKWHPRWYLVSKGVFGATLRNRGLNLSKNFWVKLLHSDFNQIVPEFLLLFVTFCLKATVSYLRFSGLFEPFKNNRQKKTVGPFMKKK